MSAGQHLPVMAARAASVRPTPSMRHTATGWPATTVRYTAAMRAGHREMRRAATVRSTAATMWAADGQMWGPAAMRSGYREIRYTAAMRAGRGEMRASGTMRSAVKSRTGSERRVATQRGVSPERASAGAGRYRAVTPGSAVRGLAPAGAGARRRGHPRDPRGIEARSGGRVRITNAAAMLGIDRDVVMPPIDPAPTP